MSKLHVIRLINGDLLLSQMEPFDKDSWILTSPMSIDTIKIKGGEATTSVAYMPGTASSKHVINTSHVMIYSPADSFFHKFYGSSLLKYMIQNKLKEANLAGKESLDRYDSLAIEHARLSILKEFGLIDENEGSEFSYDHEEVLH